jgi:hypothetical protein
VGDSPSWRGAYHTPDGKVTWDVDVESLACPVAVITQDSIAAARQFSEANRTHKLGGVLYGPDSSRWPARWHDVVTILQYEIEREQAAANRALNARRPT